MKTSTQTPLSLPFSLLFVMLKTNLKMTSAVTVETTQLSSTDHILITGGCGFIGSHTVLELLLLPPATRPTVVVVDNLCNSSLESLNRVQKMAQCEVKFHKVDLLDRQALSDVFEMYPPFTAVIHFAGLKAVGESVQMPLKYYHNNISGTIVLLEVMAQYGVKRIVFSSSATVYGEPERLPLNEQCRLGATNPYGKTKQYIEGMLQDCAVSDQEMSVVLLRYFNPVGAHESGLIGEDPTGIPNNLMPFVSQVAVGKRPLVTVYGNDYPTKDGTGVRDYIHVTDLALGHLAALGVAKKNTGCMVYNLGTGVGYSVLEMIRAMSKASGREIPYKISDRRPGDIASAYADPLKAGTCLKWKATRSLQTMCDDLWRWQSHNPNGFNTIADSSLLTQWQKILNLRAMVDEVVHE